MKKKLLNWLLLVSVMMILAACGNSEVKPANINEATDKCETCNMAVADNHNATQVVLENGKSLLFDDIGCLFEWSTANKNQKNVAKFVRDYNDNDWVVLEEATYVYNPSIKTPMAYNVISFKDSVSAEKFVAENAGSTLLTAAELEQHNWIQNEDMLEKHGSANHSHSGDTENSHHEETDAEDTTEHHDSKNH